MPREISLKTHQFFYLHTEPPGPYPMAGTNVSRGFPTCTVELTWKPTLLRWDGEQTQTVLLGLQRKEHCLDLESNQTVGTVWAKLLIKAWLSRYQSGPSWPHVPTQSEKAFSQHSTCSPSPSASPSCLQPGCLRGTWRLSSCSGQLGSPLVIAQAVHALGWFVLVNKVLWTTRGGLYNFYWVFSWMSPENTSGRNFLFSSVLLASLSDIFSTRLFLALKQGKSIQSKRGK